MASPFDNVQDSTHRRREDFHFRSQTRKTVEQKRVTTHAMPKRDILWQHHPDRVLKYRPGHLHYYGWIPMAVMRNWKATVFADIYLHVQNYALLLWMAAIHITGLGVRDDDLATLVTMFGTPYIGGIFNCGMLVIFTLGLFITLVVNRWWSIRAAYAKLMGTTTDLCMIVANTIKNPQNAEDLRVQRARTEITRLLNLGHLLVLAKADAQNEGYKKAYGLRSLVDSMKSSFHRIRNQGLNTTFSVQSGSPVYAKALQKPRNLLTFDNMVSEGLMNRDEWELLNDAENDGMAAFEMVYYWTQSLVNRCKAAEWLVAAPQMLPLLLNKINGIVEAGTSIINTINSQMPYPYVHLVSFVVHVYLMVLATWFGSFLHTGRLGELFGDGAGAAKKSDDDIQTSVWMIFWCYVLMTMANVTYQGLLNMHTLLDNPFGDHCTKFPLRASVGRVTNATRTMLLMAEKLPAAFEDVFEPPQGDEESTRGSVPASRPSAHVPGTADFMNPTPTGQFPLESKSSWQTGENDRSSHLSQTTKERTTDAVPAESSKRRPSDGTHSASGRASHADSVSREKRSAAEGRRQEKQLDRVISGDSEIQEQFLQGVTRSSMRAMDGTQGDASSSDYLPATARH